MRSYGWLEREAVRRDGNCENISGSEPEILLAHQINCFVKRNLPVLRQKKEKVKVSDFEWCEEDCPAARLCNNGRRKNGRKKI